MTELRNAPLKGDGGEDIATVWVYVSYLQSWRFRGICHRPGYNSRPESVTVVFFILAHNPELSLMETLKIYCPMNGRGGWGEDEIVGEEICEGEKRKIKSRCGGSIYRTGVFGRGSVSQGEWHGLAGRLQWTQRNTDGRRTDVENWNDGMGGWAHKKLPTSFTCEISQMDGWTIQWISFIHEKLLSSFTVKSSQRAGCLFSFHSFMFYLFTNSFHDPQKFIAF